MGFARKGSWPTLGTVGILMEGLRITTIQEAGILAEIRTENDQYTIMLSKSDCNT
jgi:hypothetical protein